MTKSIGTGAAGTLPPAETRLNLGTPNKQLVFCSAEMHDLVAAARRYARSTATVLITGESGSGKELLSRLIHQLSPRASQVFLAFHGAALPETLIESEWFGHERGAFAGAFQQRAGLFQRAHRGTILLDEIGEIPDSAQARLLRVIEEREVQRLGSSETDRIDVRLIATSHRDLYQESIAGRFRWDLYHRLNVLALRVPPLRERPADIPLLADHFRRQFQQEAAQPIVGIDERALSRLCEYSWPGNVRELRNVIHRACLDCDAEWITCRCLPPIEDGESPTTPSRQLFDIEKQAILESLSRHRGNKTAAASELGVTPRTLTNKLRLYHRAA